MLTAPRLTRLVALAAALSTTLLSACERSPAPAASSAAHGSTAPLKVIATTGMVADLVRNVAGDRANVTALMGDGVDPHLYKPTRDDIAALLAADVVVYNGLLLEGKMTDAFDRVRAAGKTVIVVADALPKERLRHEGQSESGSMSAEPLPPDPHIWMDPSLWADAARGLGESLAAADSAYAAEHRARSITYAKQLLDLDAAIQTAVDTIPQSARVLVTAHDAFSYFGARYRMQVKGIQGISTESEAGVADVERLVDVLVTGKVPAVFVESTVSDRNITALIAGAAAKGHTVTLGGRLFSDAMGPPGTIEGTYLGMLRHNARTITAALGGSTAALDASRPTPTSPTPARP